MALSDFFTEFSPSTEGTAADYLPVLLGFDVPVEEKGVAHRAMNRPVREIAPPTHPRIGNIALIDIGHGENVGWRAVVVHFGQSQGLDRRHAAIVRITEGGNFPGSGAHVVVEQIT